MDLVHRKYFNEIRRKSYKIVFVLIRQSQQDNALLKSDKSSLLEILPNQGFDQKEDLICESKFRFGELKLFFFPIFSSIFESIHKHSQNISKRLP